MLYRVLETIKENNMLKAGDKVVCAVSGGADSMALLCVLYELKEKLGITLYAANVNHSIRGDEGDMDSLFVKDFCQRLGVGLFYKKIDVPRLAKESHLSEEECGRKERYAFFDEISHELDGCLIATGHHKNDNAETVLFNLFRGSGARGLGGIPYKRGNIIRPLLSVTREDTENYLKEKNIAWCEDYTNKMCEYSRNMIRNIIIKEAEKKFSNVCEKITEASEAVKCDDEYLCILANASGAFENGEIDIKKLAELHESLRRRVIINAFDFWQVRDVTREKIRAAEKLMNMQSGKGIDLEDNIRIENSYGKIRICKKTLKETQNNIPTPICGESLEIRTADGVWSIKTVDKKGKMRDNKMMAFFDADKLPQGTEVRTRRDGDYMHPYGMTGRQKIKKIFINLKIDKQIRDKISMLAAGDEVLFVPGIRRSAKYQPDETTQRILMVEFLPQRAGK